MVYWKRWIQVSLLLSIFCWGLSFAASFQENKLYTDYAGPPPEDFASTVNHSPELEPAQAIDPSAPIYMSQAQDLWDVLVRHFELQNESTHPAVAEQIHWFLAHPKILDRMLNNAVPYLYYVYQEVEKKNFPAELALLPLVESGYSPYAYSRSGATGLWQLMPATASSDGLRINWWYDGRRDTLVSTNSALNYLQFLHTHFHDWPLAISAYNVGQGSVQNALDYNSRMSKALDFWSLSLPAETRDYFPKLLAIANIIMNAKHYGVHLPYIPDQPYFQSVTLHSQASLEQLSKMTNISESIIQRLNPAFRRWATEPNNSYPILLPVSRVNYFKQHLAQWTGKVELSWMYHQARGGETLAKIARNYHTNLALLSKINGLPESAVIKSNESLLVPVRLHRRFNMPDEQAIYNDQVSQPASPAHFKLSSKIVASDSLEEILNKLQEQ